MTKYIFLGVFSFALFFQVFWWQKFSFLLDGNVWAHQAEYVQTSNPEELDAMSAYGHPGGPIIEGTILIHNLFGMTYNNALLVFLALFNSILVSSIAVLCYLLRRNSLWWLGSSGILIGNRALEYITPPSLVVSFLVVLLLLLTLYIYEGKNKGNVNVWGLWSLVAGLSVATRADIGSVITVLCLVPLVSVQGIKKGVLLLGGAFLAFCLFDPFMWFMPLKHLSDLVSKIIYHYADYSPTHLSFYNVIDISSLAIISIFLAITFLSSKKKLMQPIPPVFLSVFILGTGFLYGVFLTAHYQAERYYVPIIFIWETLLPLFILHLISGINLDFIKTEKIRNRIVWVCKVLVLIVLIGSQTYLAMEFL